MQHILDPDTNTPQCLGRPARPPHLPCGANPAMDFLHREPSLFADMTNLPLALRTELETHFQWWTTRTATHQKSGGWHRKNYCWSWLMGKESNVYSYVKASDGTICISTQVGCAMGCVFCASGPGWCSTGI